MTNTTLLKERIQESGLRHGFIAKKLGIGTAALTRKINNRVEFKASEIEALCVLLGITDPAEREAVFFAEKVA